MHDLELLRLCDIARRVSEQRDKTYNSRAVERGGQFEALGRTWAILLSAHTGIPIPALPPSVVHMMLVQMKMLRAVIGTSYHEDNFVDAMNYLSFASEEQRREKTPLESEDDCAGNYR